MRVRGTAGLRFLENVSGSGRVGATGGSPLRMRADHWLTAKIRRFLSTLKRIFVRANRVFALPDMIMLPSSFDILKAFR
jgi:hypothetical protein